MATAVGADRLIKPPETAEALGVSPRTVRHLAELGVLPRVYVLGAPRYRLTDVERIIREGTRGPSRRVA